MPAVSERQRRFFGAELGRARAGKKTQTGMPASQLRDFAMKPKKKIRPGAGSSFRGTARDQKAALKY